MREPLRRSVLPMFALACAVALSAAPVRAAFISSTCQICVQADCETGPTVTVAGQVTDMSRFWSSPDGFAFAAATSIATDYVGFGAFARASGSHNPPGDTTFLNFVSRSGRSYGNFNDTFTAGSGGGSGFLRLPLHVAGSTSVSWQNGAGSTGLSVTCQSYQPGAPFALGNCTPASLAFTNDAVIDEVLNLDVPIVLGSPVTYTMTIAVGAGTGYGYGDLVPFVGQSEISVATLPFAGAIVLDANRQPIPDATVSVGESGFDYQAVPEPSSLLGALTALAALMSARRR